MAKKVAFYSIFIAVAILAGFIESLIPVPVPIPGVKLGIANVVVVIVLYFVGAKHAFVISILRIFMSGLLFSGLGALMYSLSGGLISFAVMYLCKKVKFFSIIGVSVTGGIAHNVGQVIMAILIVNNLNIVYVLPVLLVSGILTGILIGFISNFTLAHLQKINIDFGFRRL